MYGSLANQSFSRANLSTFKNPVPTPSTSRSFLSSEYLRVLFRILTVYPSLSDFLTKAPPTIGSERDKRLKNHSGSHSTSESIKNNVSYPPSRANLTRSFLALCTKES